MNALRNRRITIILITLICLLPLNPFFINQSTSYSIATDIDPLTDIHVTFSVDTIRSFEKSDHQVNSREYVDRFNQPDFFIKIWINDKMFRSPIWWNTRYVTEPNWSKTVDVSDTEELVRIKIQLWDFNFGLNKRCDISNDPHVLRKSTDIELLYSIKYGVWWGEDYTSNNIFDMDPSGYGRLNGCDDGSYYKRERDCELFFQITQSDYDKDGVPYWVETEVFNTDPTVDDSMRDDDADKIPLLWEYYWGHRDWKDPETETYQHSWFYDPFVHDDHTHLDPDNDGLTNYEEYLTWQWGSDPFRKDLFVELDQMQAGPDGKACLLPEKSKELIRTAFNRRNIVYHLDDGWMGGGEMIPYDEKTTGHELSILYDKYFLHDGQNLSRKGIFHYGLVINEADPYGFIFKRDAWQISRVGMEKQAAYLIKPRNIVYASAYMHECGHTLGILNSNTPGCDDQEGKYPWQLNYWKWRPYKSVMNYGYMYTMVDYSDGSRPINDFNDWGNLDFYFFKS